MQGAKEYCEVFDKIEQFGKIVVVPGIHARGVTFHIYIVSDGYTLPNGCGPWTDKNSVEVYGITGGQPGWTETYGWLHRGPWMKDFADIVRKRKEENKLKDDARKQNEVKMNQEKSDRIQRLLDAY